MNRLNVNILTNKFQNLIIQNQMPTLKKFKNEIWCLEQFVIFPIGQLEKIYAFIEAMQKIQTGEDSHLH